MELHSADDSVPERKLNFALKIRSLALNFASIYFLVAFAFFSFLILNKKK